MFRIRTLVLTLALVVGESLAWSGGAGTCSATNDALSTSAMGGPLHATTASNIGGGWFLTAAPTDEKVSSYTITLSRRSVQQFNSETTGSFTYPTGYKSPNCASGATDYLTHDSAANKTAPVSFVWTPSKAGPHVFRGVVVDGPKENWYVLGNLSTAITLPITSSAPGLSAWPVFLLTVLSVVALALLDLPHV